MRERATFWREKISVQKKISWSGRSARKDSKGIGEGEESAWDVPRRMRASFPGEPTHASRRKTALRMHRAIRPRENSSADIR